MGKKGYLVLETGDLFEGEWIGSRKDVEGEVVFNTSMTGYQEMMTDPSYAGQILTFCYPMIGNYGINLNDNESSRPHLKGVIVGESCDEPSHYQSSLSFSTQMEQAGIAGLAQVDTRSLVRLIRTNGTVKGRLTTDPPQPVPTVKQNWVKQLEQKERSIAWIEQVSIKTEQIYENDGAHLVLLDYGYKKSILDAMLAQGCRVTVVPYSYTYKQVKALQPDGVVFSNGPGNPMVLRFMFEEIRKITEAYPSLGICLGHQLIALAHGAKTEKLKYGHRGGNHPVRHLETGRVSITSQNHGYVVVEESIDQHLFQITYTNVNDGSVEGLRHIHLPIQSVQFHPEAHPGPSDTAYIFDAFIQQLAGVGEINYAIK